MRLVEGDKVRSEVPKADRKTWFQYDYPLMCAFVDRWRPETHTFHLPLGEVALTLEDVALLAGLPCCGIAMGPIDIPVTWREDFLARFANVPRNARVPFPYAPFVDPHGPTATWLHQFSVRTLSSSLSLFSYLSKQCND